MVLTYYEVVGAAHLCGQLPVLFTNETSSNIVDTFVPCDPNMYSHLCTEIYLSLFTALDLLICLYV
jgi:hypothetical protein